MKASDLQEIHNSMENGQRKQAVEQIDDYGTIDFFVDYTAFLFRKFKNIPDRYQAFSDVTISYFRIKGR